MDMIDAPTFGKIKVNPAWKVAIARSIWYPDLTSSLTNDAANTLVAAGISRENIRLLDAPGSYELPLLAKKSLEAGADGIIVFGVVAQGATHHARLVADQSAAGCMRVQLDTGKPVIYEVLFVNSLEDAVARSVGPKAKGTLAARTLMSQLANIADLH